MDEQTPKKENTKTESNPHNEEINKILNDPEKTQEDLRSEFYEKCRIIAESYDILSLFSESLERSGLTGNDKTKKLLFLALTSRLSNDPISVIVKGESSTGKSYTVDRVIECFPPEAIEIITSVSDKALAYFNKPIKHRFLYFREASGLTKNAEYLVRSIISEKRIDHYTVGSSGNGPELRHIHKEGPSGVIITTTKFLVHKENETRLLTVGVESSESHMKSIFMKQSEHFKNGAPLNQANIQEIEMWKSFNSWIANGTNEVAIPFSDAIFSQIPPAAARLCRDNIKLGELIKAHALIHQIHRDKTSEGKIIAEIRDYEVVYELSADWFAEGVDLSIPDDVRSVVEAVETLLNQGSSNISQSEIKELIGMEKTAVSRNVNKAIDSGYLRDTAPKGRGRKSQLILGEPLPDDKSVLPSPEKVRKLLGLESQQPSNVVEIGQGIYPSGWTLKSYDEQADIREYMGKMKNNAAENSAVNDAINSIHPSLDKLGAAVTSVQVRNNINPIESESEGNGDDIQCFS